MSRFVAYVRVSTAEQDTLTAQLAACTEMASRLNGKIVETIEDKLSGLDSSRPGYQRVLTMARSGEIDGVVVYRLDRFGRDPAEALRAFSELSKLGVQVHSASEPNIDEDMRGIFAVLAGRESRIISQRVRMGMRQKAAQGIWQTTPPPGYRSGADHRLEPDALAPMVTQLFEIAAEGRLSLRHLRDKANALGITSGRGHALSRTHVYGILTNRAYLGEVSFGKRKHAKFPSNEPPVVCENAHSALIDAATFVQVQAAFAKHQRFPAAVRQSKWMLTGLLVCGACGGKMYGAHGGRGYAYKCFTSEAYGSCETRSVGGLGVDAEVKRQMRQFEITAESRAEAEHILIEQQDHWHQEANEQRKNLIRDRESHEAARMDLARQLLGQAGELIPAEVYQKLETEEARATAIIDAELASLDETPPPPDLDSAIEFLRCVDWDDLDELAWAEAAALLIERVMVRRTAARSSKWQLELDVEVCWTPAAALLLEAVGIKSGTVRY